MASTDGIVFEEKKSRCNGLVSIQPLCFQVLFEVLFEQLEVVYCWCLHLAWYFLGEICRWVIKGAARLENTPRVSGIKLSAYPFQVTTYLCQQAVVDYQFQLSYKRGVVHVAEGGQQRLETTEVSGTGIATSVYASAERIVA